MKLTVGSLFAGIGGFDLGLERTCGFEVRWQVEIDDYCRQVLEKHWPHVKRYGDIRVLSDVERVDVLCGGFPCQDISNAGKRAGIDGERSGLWSEYVRLIRLVRPHYVLVENVSALLGRGMERVLGDLSEGGYDAEWDVIPACAVGAPHIRDRVWIVAYASSTRGWRGNESVSPRQEVTQGSTALAYADEPGLSVATRAGFGIFHSQAGASAWRESRRAVAEGRHQWAIEPNVGRVAHGVSNRVHRLRALGNSIVPQIAEWIGKRILEQHERRLQPDLEVGA